LTFNDVTGTLVGVDANAVDYLDIVATTVAADSNSDVTVTAAIDYGFITIDSRSRTVYVIGVVADVGDRGMIATQRHHKANG
jgi:hypothetical protein